MYRIASTVASTIGFAREETTRLSVVSDLKRGTEFTSCFLCRHDTTFVSRKNAKQRVISLACSRSMGVSVAVRRCFLTVL